MCANIKLLYEDYYKILIFEIKHQALILFPKHINILLAYLSKVLLPTWPQIVPHSIVNSSKDHTFPNIFIPTVVILFKT